jgi:hypothetical protein
MDPYDGGRSSSAANAILERKWADYLGGDEPLDHHTTSAPQLTMPHVSSQLPAGLPHALYAPIHSASTAAASVAMNPYNYDVGIPPTSTAALVAAPPQQQQQHPLDITPHSDVSSRITVMQGMIRRWASERIGLRGNIYHLIV